MIVSIHQPHFLPWLGYFDRMRQSDLFVLLDHVQFERQNYQNRVQIKTGQGLHWLVVPVQQRSRAETILDKQIDNQGRGRHHWAHRVYASIEHSYRGAPGFAAAAGELRELLSRPWTRLVELDLALIDWLRARLDIHTPMVKSSELGVTGHKAELVLSICQATRATVFLGGLGASRDYLDAGPFQRAGIDLAWQRFEHPRYPQRPMPGRFVAGVSALDLVLNAGADAARILREANSTERAAS
ncbi:MAG TPA: WbqC family protein [Polyangiaceae bacterium]|nr:WbqC family protein [Polyangiaceae bacterium]